MAINLNIASVSNAVSKTVSVDFACEVLSASADSVYDPTQRYFFKFYTNAKDTDGLGYTVRLVTGLDDLALNGAKRSSEDTTNAYEDIKTLIEDYAYDFINGHTANQFTSGVSAKSPMDLS